MEMSFEVFNQKIEDFIKEGMSEGEAIDAAATWLDEVKEQEDFTLANDVINNLLASCESVDDFFEEASDEAHRIIVEQSEWRRNDD